MRRSGQLLIVALLFAGVAGFVGFAQLRDIASSIDGVVTQRPVQRVNPTDTSAAVSLAGRIGAGVVVGTGIIRDGTTNLSGYLVVQDSGATASWTNRDSVAIDSTDGKYYDLHYTRTQPNVRVRTILRGWGANDTTNIAAVVLRVCQRAPC